MDRTDSRFAPSPETASYDVASPFDLRPAGMSDRLAFEPVPLRYRADGLTPGKQREYVEALADCGLVREAAARIGISEQAINRVRRRADAASFDRACEAAQMFGARRLRSIAFERAVEGTLKGHYYRGELVGQERVYDNRLLTYLLGKTEHWLQPSAEVRAVFDDWEPHMDALEQGRKPPDSALAAEADELAELEVWRQEDGEWRTSFPPPADFHGFEEGQWDGSSWYCRALTPRELSAIEADVAAERDLACARRDRFFGFATDGDSTPIEAETSETSEPFASQSQDGEGGGTGCQDGRRPQCGGGVEGGDSADPAPEPPASAQMPLHHAMRGPPSQAEHGEAETTDDSPPPPHPNPSCPASLLLNHREQ